MSITIQDAATWSLPFISKWQLDKTNITISANIVDAEWKIAHGNTQLCAMEGLSDAKRWAEIYARENGLL